MYKTRYTKNYIRHRIRNPSEFKKHSFRTKTVSKHTKIILGHLKRNNKQVIQAIIEKRKRR